MALISLQSKSPLPKSKSIPSIFRAVFNTNVLQVIVSQLVISLPAVKAIPPQSVILWEFISKTSLPPTVIDISPCICRAAKIPIVPPVVV